MYCILKRIGYCTHSFPVRVTSNGSMNLWLKRRFWYVPEMLSDAHCELRQLIRTEAICSTVHGPELHRWERVETGVRMREQKRTNGFDHNKSSSYVEILGNSNFPAQYQFCFNVNIPGSFPLKIHNNVIL